MKGIIGAISGDIIGSSREFYSIKTKDFNLFTKKSIFTDDTIMTLAIANWLIEDKTSKKVLIDELKYWGNKYPNAGYGRMFMDWLKQDSPIEEVQNLAYTSAAVTHNHPEGIKGALATADAIYLARIGAKKEEIKDHIELRYQYDLDFELDDIRPFYGFDVSCAGSVPESIVCFLEADDFEDTIRNAVSLGGDSDTQAAIAGSIASAYWDVPLDIYDNSLEYLDKTLKSAYVEFEEKFILPNL